MRSAGAVRGVAVACYLVALAGAGLLAVRVVLLGTGAANTTAADWLGPWAADLGWLLAFGVQHTGMARECFKRRWTRVVPAALERSVYAALSGALLTGLALTWQPIPGPAFWLLPVGLVVVPLAAGLGLAAINARFDHAGLFGLRQAWAAGRALPPEWLQVVGPYRFVRHPLMVCLLAFLWLQPVMPPTLALLSGGLTGYIAVGLIFEERDLLKRFGPAYAAYRRRVPALVPWRPPARADEFEEVR
jgi:protein-S-isoprenylcysteine O-methyltransferase Ste14